MKLNVHLSSAPTFADMADGAVFMFGYQLMVKASASRAVLVYHHNDDPGRKNQAGQSVIMAQEAKVAPVLEISVSV